MDKKQKFHIPPVVTLLLIVLAIVGFLFFCKWYHTPIPYSAGTVHLYGDDDRETDAVVEWTLARSFFSPSEIDGTILLDGKEYVVWGCDEYGFWEGLNLKLRGVVRYPVFRGSPLTGGIPEELLYIRPLDEEGNLWFIQSGEQNASWFTDPAYAGQ